MSNVTLSAGIRRTPARLQIKPPTRRDFKERELGKKVNTAFDNPTALFTSQSLDNRASGER